jgi:hypothetical protein
VGFEELSSLSNNETFWREKTDAFIICERPLTRDPYEFRFFNFLTFKIKL